MAAWIAAPRRQSMVHSPGLAATAPADANWCAGLSFSLTLRSGGPQGNVPLAPARASRPRWVGDRAPPDPRPAALAPSEGLSDDVLDVEVHGGMTARSGAGGKLRSRRGIPPNWIAPTVDP